MAKEFVISETKLKIGDIYKANKISLKVKIHSFDKKSRFEFNGSKSEPQDCIMLESLSNVMDFKVGEIFPYWSEVLFLKTYHKI